MGDDSSRSRGLEVVWSRGWGAWLAVVMASTGCSDDGKATDEDTDTTGPTTGDGDGDGDGDPVEPCTSLDQCFVINDCCTCAAVPVGTEVPECDHGCDQTECDAQGLSTEPECSIGACVFEPLSCDLSDASCDIIPPRPCEAGLVQSVVDGCYGACVEPSQCASLPSECDASTCGDGFACVTTQSGAPSRCIPLPAICDGVTSCECVDPWWGEVCASSCAESSGTLLCEDGG